MKERPILMNEASVRGICEERKTQTRRVIEPQPVTGSVVVLRKSLEEGEE